MKLRRFSFALQVSIAYTFIGGFWILASDKLISGLFSSPEQVLAAQEYKDWFFVFLTAISLCLLFIKDSRSKKKAEQHFDDWALPTVGFAAHPKEDERYRAEEAQKGREARYHTLAKQASEAIFIHDRQGKFVEANQCACDMLGYSRVELLQRSINELMSAEELALRPLQLDTFSGGQTSPSGHTLIRKDGKSILVELSTKILPDGMLISIARNRTERRLVQESLTTTEQGFRSLIERSMDGVALFSRDGHILYQSPASTRILGYSPGEMTGHNITEFIYPPDRQHILQAIEEILQTAGRNFTAEIRFLHKSGDVRWLEITSTNRMNEPGVNAIVANYRDATERKLTEEALRAAESRYRALVENISPVVYADSAEDLTTFYVSPQIQALLGYTPEEWLADDTSWSRSIHPEDLPGIRAKAEYCSNKGETFSHEYRMLTQDGRIIWVRDQSSLIYDDSGNRLYWQGTFLDITEQKRAQEALHRREAILEAVAFAAEQFLIAPSWENCIPQVLERLGNTAQTSRVYVFKRHYSAQGSLLISQLFEWAADGVEPQINNPNLQNMDFAQAGYRRWINLFDDGLPAHGIIRDLPAEEQPEFRREGILSIICFPIPVGDDWWGFIGFDDCRVERDWSAIEIETLRAAVNMLGAAIQRKSAEEAVFSGETSYQGLFNSVNNAIYIQDMEGHFLDVNDGATQMHNYPKEFFIGKTLESLGIPERNEHLNTRLIFQQALQGEPQRFELWGVRSNGQVFPEEVRLYKGIYFGEEVVIAVAQDITERKRAEDSLQRQLKELTVLHSIGVAESAAKSSDELIQRVTDIIGDTLYSDNCGILILDAAGETLQPHFSYRGTNKQNLFSKYPVAQGVTGKVVRTRVPIRLGDVSKDPAYLEVTPHIHSELCVPISNGEKTFGVLNVESKQADAFTDADERLLNTIAGGMANALERLQLFQAEQRRRKTADTLREATSALTTSLELPHLFKTILSSVRNLVPYDSASISLENAGRLELVAEIGLPENLDLIGKRSDEPERWDFLMLNRKPLIMDDAQVNPLFEKWAGTEYIRGWIGIPLIAHDKLIGLLSLDSRTVGAFSDEHAILLQTFANYAAVAIENARLFKAQQRRREQADMLREATSALTSTIELETVLETILETLAKLVPSRSASVELINGEEIEIVAQRGLPDGYQFVGVSYPFEPQKWDAGLRQPVILADVQADPRFKKFPGTDTEYIHGWMGVPLITQDRLIGYLNLDSDEVGCFTDEHAALAQTLANHAATAIENARGYEEERRRTKIIEALADIANEITRTDEIESLLEKVSYRTLELLKASHVAIYLLQDDNITIKPVTAQGTFSREILSHLLSVGEGITGNIIRTGRSEIINDTRNDPRRIRVPGTAEEDGMLETMMSSALILREKPIGAINVWRLKSDGLFNESELNFLISIAHQTSISIEASRLFRETVRRAQEMTAIAEVGRDISATLQLDAVLERIANYAKELLRTETSAVYLSEPGNKWLRAIAAIGVDADELKNFPLEIGTGIVGNIARSKIGEIVNDVTSDPRAITVEGTDLNPNEHIMGVPVLNTGELTGLLVVWRTGKGNEFIQSELDFLTSLAQQAAVAIENARLFQAEQRRRQEAENLRVAATAITSTLEPGQVLETILVALQQVVGYDSAAIFQLEGKNVRITAAKGFPDSESLINRTYSSNNELLLQIQKSRQPLILEDGQKSPYYEKWAAADSARGWMGVPLIARGEVIGYITMDSMKVGAFNRNDANLAQTFAHQAAAAIENARLFHETRQRMEELEVVSRISVALRLAQGTQKMLSILLDQIKKSLETDTAAIWLYDHDKQELIQKIASGQLAHLPRANFKPHEGIVGTVFVSGQMHLSPEYAKDPRASRENAEFFGKGWGGITVPIRTASEIIGVLVVAIHASRWVDSHHIRLLTTIAEIAGNAINRSNLYEKSEEQVRRLTTLREIDTAISSTFDLRVTLDILIGHLLSKMGVSAAAVLILNPDSQTLNFYSGAGFHDQDFVRNQAQAGNNLASQVLLTQKDIYIQSLGDLMQSSSVGMNGSENFVSYYGMPLQSKGLIRGVLELYFRQPIIPNSDWRDFLHTLAGQATIAIDNTRLFENLQRTNQELTLAYDTTLEGWSKALELRDKETQGHTRRVTDLTLELAQRMNIPESQLTHIRRGVLVHDIGKMAVPDNILRKDGPLTEEEWVEMRKHPQYAFDLLYPIYYLRPALDIAYYHHEWWDGTGYPSGLKGNSIPLSARIFAVVDVWDAMLSDRPYRLAMKKRQVMQYIHGLSGKQFDPAVVVVFLKMMKEKATRTQRKKKPERKAPGLRKVARGNAKKKKEQ